MGDVHPSIPPVAPRNAGAVMPGASDEPAFDEAAMCAIVARRAEADARRECPTLSAAARRGQILPIFRSSSSTPANIVVRVRDDDSAGSSVREVVVTTMSSPSIKIVPPRS